MSYSASLPVTVQTGVPTLLLILADGVQPGVVLLDAPVAVEASESLLRERYREADCDFDRGRCTVQDHGHDGDAESLV